MIKQIPIGPMMNFAYLVGDDEAKLCAVVDPAWDATALAREAKNAGWRIEKILITHSHYDHANALEALHALTGAEIFAHKADAPDLPGGLGINETSDGTTIPVGSLTVKCMHTPGHTRGSQCFIVDGAIITGDTLFVDNCGRVDLPESSPKDMLVSMKKLSELPATTVVYPGHDYGPSPTSTIGEQQKSNPYLCARSESVLL